MVGVDGVDVRGRRPDPAPCGDRVEVPVGEVVVDHRAHLVARVPEQVRDHLEQPGRLWASGVVAVQRLDQVGPGRQRGDGPDPGVERRPDERDARPVRHAGRPDSRRVGGGVADEPVHDGRQVGHVLGAGDVDLAARVPPAAAGVGQHGVAASREGGRLCQVLVVVESPAVDEHDRRVPPRRGGLDDVRLEDDAVACGDVDRPEPGGRRGRGGRGRRGRGDGTEQGETEQGGPQAGAGGHHGHLTESEVTGR